jgi:hypothetical protein
MVHALEEAWRVLVPHGVMIDARPLSVDMPLEVVYNGTGIEAGLVDLSPGLEIDIAADKAIEQVTEKGLFGQISMQQFLYAYEWKTYHGLLVDLAENWQGEINLPKEVQETARRLYRQNPPGAKMRLPMQMILGMYIKLR